VALAAGVVAAWSGDDAMADDRTPAAAPPEAVARAAEVPSPQAGPQGVPSACGLPGLADAALQRINAMRAGGATCGRRGRYPAASPLTWNAALASAAAAHAADMAARDVFGHTGPDGADAGRRLAAAGYRARTWGENIAAGFGGVDAVVAAWFASDGHCATLMSAAMRDVGLACVRVDGASYPTYWALNVAAPR
jgi:uncharacterized protein YkwD